MKILEAINNRDFYIADKVDVVVSFSNGATIIALKQVEHFSESIDVTEQMVVDVVNMKEKEFTSKYEVKPEAELTIEAIYHHIRNFIVDEKLPLPIKKSGGKKSKKGSRKQEVVRLMSEGYNSPTEIAKIINSHPSYVSQLMKKLKE